jgi:dihydroxy-acid dehydratase
MVVFDIPTRELRVELGDDEIKARLSKWTPPPPRYQAGVFAKYARLVSSAALGAITQ